jgi:nucleoside-diphosphate-sugar epimerase
VKHSDQILVTGGSGFIGGRLVETLVDRGFRVRVATSDFRHCERISQLPVEIVKADLRDHEALSSAVSGCDVVFHAAYRFGGRSKNEKRINFDGTRVLAEAFLRSNGRRFVHISSIAAYRPQHDGEITETSPREAPGDWYGGIKGQIEVALLEFHRTHKLPVAILQPTIVYGPRGTTFTVRLLEELRSNCVGLPHGGICNAVYVDDVITAALLAADQDSAVGDTFIISGPQPTTWREFYTAYARMLDKDAVIELGNTELEFLRSPIAKSARFLKRLIDEFCECVPKVNQLKNAPNSISSALPSFMAASSIYVHDGFWANVYASKSRVRIDKARTTLGYNPTFGLVEGMRRTSEWARSANLLRTRTPSSFLVS